MPKEKKEEKKPVDSKDFIEMKGEVLELMPATTFKVRLENGHEILAHLSGRMRMSIFRAGIELVKKSAKTRPRWYSQSLTRTAM